MPNSHPEAPELVGENETVLAHRYWTGQTYHHGQTVSGPPQDLAFHDRVEIESNQVEGS